MSHLIETYLKRVDRGLWTLAPAVRADEVAELRHHLLSLAASFEGQGLSENEAAQAAIRQIGSSDVVSLRLRAAYGRSWLRRKATTLPAMILLATLAMYFPTFMNAHFSYEIASAPNLRIVHIAMGMQQQIFWSLLIGALAGYVSLRRAVIALPVAGLVSALIGSLVSGALTVFPSFVRVSSDPVSVTSPFVHFLSVLNPMFQAYVGWVLFGLIGALAGHLVRRQAQIGGGHSHA